MIIFLQDHTRDFHVRNKTQLLYSHVTVHLRRSQDFKKYKSWYLNKRELFPFIISLKSDLNAEFHNKLLFFYK